VTPAGPTPVLGLDASFGASWALVGLALLPVLVWLFRRRPRFERRVLPSLMFLGEAHGDVLRTQRRAFGVDLALALGGLTALVLAAAQPAFGARRLERDVRVVVAGGAPAAQAGYDARVEAALARVRAALGAEDRLDVARLPAEPGGAFERRPTAEALLAAARAGAPALAVVVSDVVVEDLEVRSVAVGDAALGNLGIVAASWEREAGGSGRDRVLVTLLNASPRPARAEVVMAVEGSASPSPPPQRRAVRLGADEVAAVLFEPAVRGEALEVTLVHDATSRDALAADDRVRLDAGSLRVAWDPGLPPAHVAAVGRALEAALGPGGVVDASSGTGPVDLRVERWWPSAPASPAPTGPAPTGPASIGQVLALAVLDAGDPGVLLAPGPEQSRGHALVQDVTFAEASLDRPRLEAPAVTWWLWRGEPSSGGLVGADAAGRWIVAFDVARGAPPAAERAAWPILVENVVRLLGGTASNVPGQAGVRREGLLDLASTRLGREARAFDPGWLDGAPRRERGRPRAVAPWGVGVGVLLLTLLWAREARRRSAAG
jgi:hypothetical protein